MRERPPRLGLLGLIDTPHTHGGEGQCPACVLATCASILGALFALDGARRDRLVRFADELLAERHVEVAAALAPPQDGDPN